MCVPFPTPIYRLLHVDNLNMLLRRGVLHAPKYISDDGLVYRTIHNIDIQRQRGITPVGCGPCGDLQDYVPFYFGPRSPMLFQLHTGWVAGYTEGQEPLIYLLSTAQAIQERGMRFVFSDGHGIACFTHWFDSLNDLDKVDWTAVYAKIWKDTVDDMDRQRRKQAEFLVYQQCGWELINEIGVFNSLTQGRVVDIFANYPADMRRPVVLRPDWYY